MSEVVKDLPREVLEMIKYFYSSRRSGNIVLNIKDGVILRASKEESVVINKNA